MVSVSHLLPMSRCFDEVFSGLQSPDICSFFFKRLCLPQTDSTSVIFFLIKMGCQISKFYRRQSLHCGLMYNVSALGPGVVVFLPVDSGLRHYGAASGQSSRVDLILTTEHSPFPVLHKH